MCGLASGVSFGIRCVGWATMYRAGYGTSVGMWYVGRHAVCRAGLRHLPDTAEASRGGVVADRGVVDCPSDNPASGPQDVEEAERIRAETRGMIRSWCTSLAMKPDPVPIEEDEESSSEDYSDDEEDEEDEEDDRMPEGNGSDPDNMTLQLPGVQWRGLVRGTGPDMP